MNLSASEIFQRIEESEAAGKKAVLFKNLTNEVPTWHDFMAHLDAVSKRKVDPNRAKGLNKKKEFTTGGIIRKGEYYSMSQIEHQDREDFFSALQPIEDMFDEHFRKQGIVRSYMSDAFLSLITDDDYATPHSDKYTHNFFVCCEGKVKWNLYEELHHDAEPVETYLLEPGDAIFVRGTSIHEVTVPEPRASVVFRIEAEYM